jgi:four helix bundle protein
MFLKLDHQKLDIYKVSKQLVSEVYKITLKLPPDERFGLTSQLRRAAVSVHLNLAEGASRISHKEGNRFTEISRSSVVEIDAALDIAVDLKYYCMNDLANVGQLIIRSFQMLSGMIDPDNN